MKSMNQSKLSEDQKRSMREYYYSHKLQYEYYRWIVHRLLKWASCVRCGNTTDLCFHHIDPKTKLFKVGMGRNKLPRVIKEIKKCAILCRSCHSKEHYKGVGGIAMKKENERRRLKT
jgi:5-methylcytosine-specific restriction endonuclease McrA